MTAWTMTVSGLYFFFGRARLEPLMIYDTGSLSFPSPLQQTGLGVRLRKAFPLISYVLIAIVWTVVLSILIIKSGSPGFRLLPTQSGLIVSEVDRPVNPVRKGDLITEISGIPYGLVIGDLFSFQDRTTDTYTVTIDHDGKSKALSVRLFPMGSPGYLKEAWPHLLLIAILLISSLLAALLAPPGQPAGLFVLSFTSFALIIANQ